MVIKLLIATSDIDYAEHLSNVLTEKHSDVFEVYSCSNNENLQGLLKSNRFDVALLEQNMADQVSLLNILLPLVMRDVGVQNAAMTNLDGINKYQRVSSIVSEILGRFAKVNPNLNTIDSGYARVTAVWSPAGGCGKTSVALAYAAQLVSGGNKTVYLSLQSFSDGAVFFSQTGKSISTIFGADDANIGLLAQSIRVQDDGSGIWYFCDPANYDDINVLTSDDVETVIKGCGYGVDEIVVDLSNEWNEKIKRIFNIADTILIVLDAASNEKWQQFVNRNNVYGTIENKLRIVANKNATAGKLGISNVSVTLPYVQSKDPIVVYKTLSGENFAAK